MLPLAALLAFALAEDRMNVLLIVSDDLTNNALSCYGSKVCQTPNLDRLAKEGVRFDRAYCQFPLCNPSRASFLTGLRPDTTKVIENATQFRKNVPDAVSIGQTFQKAGYEVTRVGKLYHYGVPAQIGTDGLDDPPSWQRTINPRGRDKDDEENDLIHSIGKDAKGKKTYGGTLSWLASDGPDPEHTDGKIAAEVAKLIAAPREKPFFIACGFFRPHTPYVAPKPWFAKYPLEAVGLPVVAADERQRHPLAAFGSYKKEQDTLTDDLRRQARQAYFAATSFMDAQVGVVLAALAERKLADKTIVAFISDHGYHLGEHGLWQKMSLFENSARVPLIVRDPRAKGNGKTCGRTVELVDLHATLADLAGAPAPKTDGVSVRKLLDDPNTAWERPAITQVTRGNPGGGKKKGGPGPYMGYSVRDERYRYTEWASGQQGRQLYDYQTDPGEAKNLADDPAHAEIVKRLAAALKR